MLMPTLKEGEVDDFAAPITWKDEAKRIVYGPVMVPGIPDSDGDVVSSDKIEEVAHKFLEQYGLMENMHTLQSVAHPVESYIAPRDITLGTTKVPKGSWVVGARVHDDAAWKNVVDGKLAGFSIVAVPTVGKDSATKRITLRDIEASGKDWDVIAIGLVDQPAVPLAKWTAIKSADPSIADRLRDLFAPKNEGLTRAEVTKLREIREAAHSLITAAEGGDRSQTTKKEEDDMSEITNEQLQEIVGGAVNEAVKPLTERLDAIEGAASEGGESGKGESTSTTTDHGKENGVTEEQLEEALEGAAKRGAEEAVTAILTKFEEHLEKTPRASVKGLATSLRGQDGHEGAKKAEDSRDPWGRRINTSS